MYTKLTFTNSSILTASDSNQIDENILETRVSNIGSGPPNSAQLLSGNLWTKTASSEWIINILNNSLQWMPFGAIDTTSNFARLYGPVYCTDADGGPYVSSEQLRIDSLANVGSWYKIGPTNSGSYDIVWPALDEISRSVDWVAIRGNVSFTGSSVGKSGEVLIENRNYNTTPGVDNEANIFHVGGQTTGTTSWYGWSGIGVSKIAVNSDNGLEIKRTGGGVGSFTGGFTIFGYGYNR